MFFLLKLIYFDLFYVTLFLVRVSKNNFCNMGGGNMSCVYANVGKVNSKDEYLYGEYNLCGN